MKKKVLFCLLLYVFFIARLSAQMPYGIQKFSISEILKQKNRVAEVINSESMRLLVFTVSHNEKQNKIQSFPEDVIYYILNGKGFLKAGDETKKIEEGKIIFIRANTDHQFSDIENDIQVLAVYSKAISSQADNKFQDFSLTDIASKRIENENAWEPFLRTKSMTFGLYMLPKSRGGDSTLIHKVDELNFVVNGSGRFTVNDYSMDVKKGDIIYVPKNNGHFFDTLKNDFDVLILWEKKSLAQK